MKTNAAPQADISAGLTLIVCTYHREALLAKTLASIAAQQRPASLAFNVLVIDNSDEGTARDVVERAARASPYPLRCAAAHPANIAVARNLGVKLATCEYIAFLDDDNQLKPGWLESVASALAAPSHDVYFGALHPDFETPARATPWTQRVFSRRCDLPPGSDLYAMGARQTRQFALSTANSIFRRAALPHGEAPFDPAYGHGGGEDYDLLCRMQQAGRRFGWLPGAAADDFVPASRCEPAYLRRRFFVGGQTFAAGAAGASAYPRVKRWWLRLRALAQAVAMAAAFPAFVWRGHAARLDYSYRYAGVLGKLSFGDVYPIYRRERR